MRVQQLLPVLALAGVGYAQVSSQTVVSNIDAITQLSSDTNNIAMSIEILNVFSTAPQLINNFRQIVSTVADDIAAMGDQTKRALDVRQAGEKRGPGKRSGDRKKRQAKPPYDEANQEAICDAFRGFVQVHQTLLATVIGKHGLLSLTPFTQPISATLRSLEGAVDTLAFGIIDDVPACAQDATQNKNALDRTLGQAVSTYDS